MELMEKLAERRIKIEAASDGSAPGGSNPEARKGRLYRLTDKESEVVKNI